MVCSKAPMAVRVGPPSTPASRFHLHFPIRSLAIDPANPATLFAGTEGRGLYKTTNGAATWQAIGTN
jgi:hypothetical protein